MGKCEKCRGYGVIPITEIKPRQFVKCDCLEAARAQRKAREAAVEREFRLQWAHDMRDAL